MPRTKEVGSQTRGTETLSSEEKIARLLGLLLVRDLESKTDQVIALRSAGFSISDVGSMLSMTENHVKVATHAGRKKQNKKVKS